MNTNFFFNTAVFIDAGVDNYQQLFDGVVAEAQPFLLDTARDGIRQIDGILQQYPQVKTVHIISHGSPGCLYLGNNQLSLGTLEHYATELQRWNIDQLLLYGCNVAAGDAGAEFVAKLRGLTGADIAASATLTGAAVKGGNWELEVRTGEMSSSLGLELEVMGSYPGVLNMEFQWATGFGATDSSEAPRAIATDSNGNVFTTGFFYDDIDIDGNDTNDLTINPLDNGSSQYLTKFDKNGKFMWAKNIGGYTDDEHVGMTIDTNGNVLFTGIFQGNTDVNEDGSSDFSSNGSLDSYVAKFDNDGTFLWAKQIGGIGTDYAEGIATDSSGNVFAVGTFANTIDINNDNTDDLTSSGHLDGYIAKFKSNGDLLWAKNIGGGGAAQYVRGIATDKNGNLLVTGIFGGEIDIDGDGEIDFTNSNPGFDSYVAKFDNNGNFIWAESIGGIGSRDYGLDIATDPSGNVSVVGRFSSNIDIDGDNTDDLTSNNGSTDGYVAKFDINGNLVFAQNIGGTSTDMAYGVAMDSNSNVLVSGYFTNHLDVNGDGIFEFDEGSGIHGYVAKYDSNGNSVSVEKIGSMGFDVATDSSDNAFVTGDFFGNIDINNDSTDDLLANGTERDNYIVKFSPVSPPDTTPPTVEAFNPNYDPKYVAPAANLVIEFNEKIQKGTGNIVIKQASDNSVVETIDLASSQVIAYGKTVTINPTADLANETGYYVEIAPGAIQDVAGNDYAGISDNSTFSFTTTTPIGDLEFTDSGQSFQTSASRNVAVADLDGNKTVDAFVANEGVNKVWLNDGIGTDGTVNFYEKTQNQGLENSNLNSYGVGLADLDGNGTVDAFVGNNGVNKVWLNDGNGEFSEQPQNEAFVKSTHYSRGVSLADLDGNGTVDAFVANYIKPNKVWLNDGDGEFSEKPQNPAFVQNNYSHNVGLADLDGNGTVDAFVANDGVNKVWLNDGNGNFSEQTQNQAFLNSIFNSYKVGLADLDGNGTVDAFVANYNGPNKVWLNDGTGKFQDSQEVFASNISLGVSLADLDRNGTLDAFVVNQGQPNKVYLNDGSGNFTDSELPLGNSQSNNVGLADLDRDGDVDAFVANYWQSHKVWLNGPINSPPEDITLSNNAINENVPANSVVGTLSTTDDDADDTFAYQLVAGTGDADNSAFSIVNDQLQIKSSPDFETKDTYNIRVQTTDAAGASYQKPLTININDVNEAPTDISLSNNALNENVAANTVVGTFSTTDIDSSEPFSYQLVAGTGDADNAAFSIVNDQLQIKSSPDFETKDTYNIRVQTTDAAGASDQKPLTININDVNEAPSGLTLSNNAINENVPANSVVGTLSTTDDDADDTFTYQLVAGTGDADNAAFSIVNDQLQIKSSPDFETKSSYNILVQTTDAAGASYEQQLTININDVNENSAPSGLTLSNNAINENVPANSVVGTLSTTDPDVGDTFTYTLVAGTGDADNAAFSIVNDQLQINSSPDFETKSSYNILVKTTDAAGASYEKPLIININDVNEAPIIGGTPGRDTIRGGASGEIIQGLEDQDKLYGNGGEDTIEGGDGNDLIYGGDDNDNLSGNNHNDRLYGQNGNDELFGNDGNDILYGGAGDDLLNGGAGSDRYYGNGGSDTFVIGEGKDSIYYFQDGKDSIQLEGGMSFADLAFESWSGSTLIKSGEETLATVYRVNADLIGADDFV